MKRLRIPATFLGLLYVFFLCSLALTASRLPDRVATHFNVSGQPDGWMSRPAHLLFTAGFGFVFPFMIVALFFVLRFLPSRSFNIPHREYWLAPQRRSETFAFLLRHSLWFACMVLCLVIGLHFLLIQANLQERAHLSTPLILGLVAAFVVGVAAWIVTLVLHFQRVAE